MNSHLKIDWATTDAAKHAVMHWHYSKCMPVGKMVKVGVWENGKFVVVVLFGRGNAPTIGAMFGLKQAQCVELVRVALSKHMSPVSQVVAIALRFLKRTSPDLKAVVSFADPEQGHHGGIYQAGGWVYCGKTKSENQFFYKGKWTNKRVFTGGARRAKISTENLPVRVVPGKHRYVIGLDAEQKKKLEKLSLPYPKKYACAVVDGSQVPPAEGVRPDPHAPMR